MKMKHLLKAEWLRYRHAPIMLISVILIVALSLLLLFGLQKQKLQDEEWLYSIPPYENADQLSSHISLLNDLRDAIPPDDEEQQYRIEYYESCIQISLYLLENDIAYDSVAQYQPFTPSDSRFNIYNIHSYLTFILLYVLCCIHAITIICNDFKTGISDRLYCDTVYSHKRLLAKHILLLLCGWILLIVLIVFGMSISSGFSNNKEQYLFYGNNTIRIFSSTTCYLLWMLSLMLTLLSNVCFCAGTATLMKKTPYVVTAFICTPLLFLLLTVISGQDLWILPVSPLILHFNLNCAMAWIVCFNILKIALPLLLWIFAQKRFQKANRSI